MSAARAAVGIVAPFAVASLAMRAMTLHAPAGVAPQLAQPLAVLTDAGHFGALQVSIAVAALAVATTAYAAVVRAVSCRDWLAPGIAGVAALVCAWTAPVWFSSDVYAYAAYGHAALRGLDPFARLALHGTDAVFAAARVQWGGSLPACVYGWGFVASAAAIVRVASPFGVAGQLAGFRCWSSLATMACGALAFVCFPGDRPARLRSAATIGCNPVALWCAAEGHNDAAAIAVGLFGVALAARRPQTGAAIAGMAGAFKLPAILAALPAAARRRARLGASVGFAVALAASWPVLAHWAAPSNVHGGYAPQASLQGLVFTSFAPFGRHIATLAAIAAAAVAALAIGRPAVADVRAGRANGWIRLAVGAWLLIPNPYPWYGIWLITVAALAPRTREASVAIWVSVAALLRYYPDAAGLPSLPWELLLDALACAPFVVLVTTRPSAIINRPL